MVLHLIPAHEEPLRCSWPIQDLAVAEAEGDPRFSTHLAAVVAGAVLHFSTRSEAVVAVGVGGLRTSIRPEEGVGEGERWSLQSQATVAEP